MGTEMLCTQPWFSVTNFGYFKYSMLFIVQGENGVAT